MPFEKDHRVAKRLGSKPLTGEAQARRLYPLGFKSFAFRVRQGTADKLKQIPNWQGRLRNYIELLVMREQRQMKRIEDGEV